MAPYGYFILNSASFLCRCLLFCQNWNLGVTEFMFGNHPGLYFYEELDMIIFLGWVSDQDFNFIFGFF